MPIFSGDKLGFGVSPSTGDEDVGPGYSTSFSNKSHTPQEEHKWVVPKTGRYNFEVWGADGGMGLKGDSNQNGAIPKYGKGGKVETRLQLTAGTEIGILIGGSGRPSFSYHSGTYLNVGEDGWGGSLAGKVVEDLCSGGNSNFNHNEFGSAGSPTNRKGAGGGGGTIVRLFDGYTDADFLIVAGGGGGAGARGDDNNNSNNQGGSGGNANDKASEHQWGRRGKYGGDTSWGWPSGNATDASHGDGSNGGSGGGGYYAGGAGGGGGCGGGGAGVTCTYCGSSGGSGGACGSDGSRGNGYTESSGGAATSKSTANITVVGSGGNSTANGMAHGGGGGGGYRGGGAGYWGNGSGHAGGGGGGGASSWVTDSATYDAKGLNAIGATPRYTSDQKPISLGNPGGGLVKIWEANKDPLGKQRPADLLASKIQYTSRSTTAYADPKYYLGSAVQSVDGGGGDDYNAWSTGGWSVGGANDCDAIVMNVSGEGTWELHSITVGQSDSDVEYPYPYKHQAWIHVIEGTTTGGVGIHTEKFDNASGTAWYAHFKACTFDYNSNAGYIEVHLDEPAVLERGQDYTIALDYSCGGTTSQSNQAQLRELGNSHRTTADLTPASLGTVTWSNVTAFNGPHGLGSNNGTSTTQGQMVQFGVRSYTKPAGPPSGDLGSQSNPAKNAREMFDAGQRNNGYYWIKGNGAISAARQIYCIMDDTWGSWSGDSTGGWMVIANHDAQKQPNQGHQARPTAYPAYVGCDSGGQGTPSTQYMIPQESFSVEMTDIPFTKVMQFVYNNADMSNISSSNWTSYTPECYWCSRFTSEQTIPTDTSAWILVFDDKGLVLHWNNTAVNRRHLYSNNDENCEAFGCMNSSGGSAPTRNGSGGNQSDPVYIATWAHSSTTNNYETISWCDTSTDGYDDWQDGSGQSDDWYVEGTGGKGNARGKPSMIVVQ